MIKSFISSEGRRKVMETYRPLASLGWMLIILGVVLVALPALVKLVPRMEGLPWWIIWVYRSNGFTFATSPLLIFISILSLIYNHLQRG
jgi:hypothetical protein